MKNRLSYFQIVLLIFAIAGCAAGTPKKTKTASSIAKPVHEPLIIPSQISAENVAELEKTVFAADKNHPDRLALRDQLVMYHLGLFQQLAEDADEEKLAQFRFALALHDPSDFRSGNVSEPASPMAEWLVREFESQGKESLVLAGLTFLSMAHPENKEYQERFMSLLDWSENVRESMNDPIERYSSLSAMYAEAAGLVPHRALLDRLADSLAKRQHAVVQFLQVFAGNSAGFSPMLFHSVISKGGIGKEFIHAWFMGGYLDEVLDKMEELDVTDGIEEDLLAILSQLREGQNISHNYHQLAQLLGPGDSVAGMKACMLALQLVPNEPRYNMCVGRFFSNMDRQLAAIDYFSNAVFLDSDTALVQAMELVQDALYRIHTETNSSEMGEALRRTEKIAKEVMSKKSIKEEEISFAASSLMETAAVIEYDDGDMAEAEKWFQMAHTLWPSRPTPVLKVAEMYYWRGEYTQGVDYLTRAMNAKDKVGGAYAEYWRAMMLEQRGDCQRELQQDELAKADYLLALKTWETADYPAEQAPVIAIRRGVLLSNLGDLPTSMEKFRQAIQLAPDRRPSYAEIISFLVVSGRLDDAREFYQLAFNQDMLDSMWKVYFSIWVDGLSRMQENKPFDLAVGYLANTRSSSWQDKLASFFIGTIDAAELRSNSQNKGQEVEADYYEALSMLCGGKKEAAYPLLQKVMDSNLYAFFEYRMAAELLKKR